MLAFPLHMAIMTDAAFPFPAIGTVHLENSITQHRADRVGEALDVTARAGDLRAAPEGQGVRPGHHRATPTARLVWETTSTYLRAARATTSLDGRAPRRSTWSAGTGVVWRLPGDLGRRYAAVSGDHNPIHLYPLTAKALGFPRQIAHGMWSKARCVAALENRLPDAVTRRRGVQEADPPARHGRLRRRAPVERRRYAFSLTDQAGAPHLAGGTATSSVGRTQPGPSVGAQRVARGRIRPSWATVATSGAVLGEDPRRGPGRGAPWADGDHWS